MSDSSNQEAELPLHGIDFVFEMGMRKIEEQVNAIEALDQKVGILLGFLGAILTGLLGVIFTATPQSTEVIGRLGKALLLVGVILIGVAIYFAFKAFLMAPYSGLPKFSNLFQWANEETKQTKNVFLYTLLAATKQNIETLASKQKYSRRAGWAVLWAFLSLLLAIIAVGTKIFHGL